MSRPRPASLLLLALLAIACKGAESATAHVQRVIFSGGPRADEAPQMLNTELPFRYPAALYARKVQGNVMLHLFVDRDGHAVLRWFKNVVSAVLHQAAAYERNLSECVHGGELANSVQQENTARQIFSAP